MTSHAGHRGDRGTRHRRALYTIYYETPQKTGTYTVVVKYRYPFFTFSGSFKLTISRVKILATRTQIGDMESAGTAPPAMC
jgi:hypothetical protein